MIYFAEINKTKHEHEMINACLLEIVQALFSNDEIVFYGEEELFSNLNFDKKAQIQKRFQKILTPKDGNKLFWIWKFIHEIILITRILRSAKKEKVKLVLFSSLSISGNYYTSIISKYLLKGPNVIVVIHGELELLKQSASLRKVERLMGQLLKKSFKINAKSVKYLILGKSIRDAILEYGFLKEDQLITIEHPYVFPLVEEYSKDSDLIFGHIGVAKKSKHSDKFFGFGQKFKENILRKEVEFIVIGRVLPDVQFATNSLVRYIDTKTFLPREEYIKLCNTIKYAVFLYDDENYELTSSGAFMDALSFHKPILCLRNKFFENLFNSVPYKIGWLLDDIEQIEQKIEQIINKDEDLDFETLSNNMARLKNNYSITTIKKTLAPQLSYLK